MHSPTELGVPTRHAPFHGEIGRPRSGGWRGILVALMLVLAGCETHTTIVGNIPGPAFPQARFASPGSMPNSSVQTSKDARPPTNLGAPELNVEIGRCVPAITPNVEAQLSTLGPSLSGQMLQSEFRLTNTGTAPCLLPPPGEPTLQVNACALVEPHAVSCAPDSPNPNFYVSQPTAHGLLYPGESTRFVLGIHNKKQHDELALELLYAQLRVDVRDPNRPTKDGFELVQPSGLSSHEGNTSNLQQLIVSPSLTAYPAHVDIGLVSSACTTQHPLRLVNRGLIPITLTHFSTDDSCGSYVKANSAQPLPILLGAGSSLELDLSLAAPDGPLECHLIAYAEETEPITVPITLKPTDSSYVSEQFVVPAPQADILVVVDTSASMELHQSKVNEFLKTLTDLMLFPHHKLAITTIDGLFGPPVIVHGTQDTSDALELLEPSPSAYEQGLESAYLALTESDWLRPQASLEIIFITDEYDLSPGLMKDYATLYHAVKAPLPPEKIRVHTVTALSECAPAILPTGASYETLSQATDGLIADLCGPIPSAFSLEVLAVSLNSNPIFPLRAVPADTGEIKVFSESNKSEGTWVWHAHSNTMHMTGDSSQLYPGALVRVNYPLCKQ